MPKSLLCVLLLLVATPAVRAEVLFADTFAVAGSEEGSVDEDLETRQTGSLIAGGGTVIWQTASAGKLEKCDFRLKQGRLESNIVAQAQQFGRASAIPTQDFGPVVAGKSWQISFDVQLEVPSLEGVPDVGAKFNETDFRILIDADEADLAAGESPAWDIGIRLVPFPTRRAGWNLRPAVAVGGEYIAGLPDVPVLVVTDDDEAGAFTEPEPVVISVDEAKSTLSIRVGERSYERIRHSIANFKVATE